MENKKAAVTSIGCKVSRYEADAMSGYLKAAGYEITDFSAMADVYVINTCTVTNVGDKKSRQMIRRAKKRNPNAIVVVTGCYSQVAPTEVAAIDGVDIILGTARHCEIASVIDDFLSDGCKKNIVSPIARAKTFETIETTEQNSRTRAYIKVEDGCSQFCSYCIIPYARGPVRSRPIADSLAEARRLCEKGVREIVLTGIHIGSYGKDLEHTEKLPDLMRAIHAVDGLERLRLSSIEPATITPEFIQQLAVMPKFCDYFHLSLQSGADRVLKAMNRRYDTDRYQRSVDLILSAFPNAAIWTDVIVGFPGETSQDFEDSLTFIERSGIANLHVFPFSSKRGTRADTMPGHIDETTKADRAKQMRQLAQKLYQQFLQQQLGKTAAVLFEQQPAPNLYQGHTKNNILVQATSPTPLMNQIRPVVLDAILDASETVMGSIQPGEPQTLNTP